MAEIIRDKDGGFKKIIAHKADGSDVDIVGETYDVWTIRGTSQYPIYGDAFFDPDFLILKSVFNIKGARDGANALAVVQAAGYDSPERTFRIHETPEELADVFAQAGIKFPVIQETLTSRICQKLFGKPFYKSVAK
jgi:hypothetical protein